MQIEKAIGSSCWMTWLAVSFLVVSPGALADDTKGQNLEERFRLMQENFEKRISSLEAENARLRNQKHQDWVKKRESEEFRAMIDDVLAAAAGRASGLGRMNMLLADGVEVGYQKGAFIRTQDGDHELHIRFLFQPRFQLVDWIGGPTENTFSVRHAQIRMFGHILDPRLKYKIMVDHNDRSLKDAWVDFHWTDCFKIRAGQFLVFFDHENIAPTWGLHLVDRSIINSVLGFERDTGVQVHGNLCDDRVQYYVFVVNGEGRNKDNVGNELMYGARVDVHLLGNQQYLVADVPTSDQPQLAWGTAVIHDANNAMAGGARVNRLTTDVTFRYKGYSVLMLVNCARNSDNNETDTGYLAEVGCFIVPQRVELVGRWADIVRDGALGVGMADPREVTVGVNLYFNGHQAKLQIDYSRLWNDKSVEGRDAHRIRGQVQLFF